MKEISQKSADTHKRKWWTKARLKLYGYKRWWDKLKTKPKQEEPKPFTIEDLKKLILKVTP